MNVKLPDFVEKEVAFSEVINNALLRYDDQIGKEEVCLYVIEDGQKYELATYRNISTTTGVQKSRKTFFSVMMFAAAVRGQYAHIHSEKDDRPCIFFDTEQAKFHAHRNYKRIIRMCKGNGDLKNVEYYALRRYDHEERYGIIKEIIHTKKPRFVIIDGVRDLVASINDERQSTEIIQSLMKWSDELNCHINVVLHMKKGEYGSPRGWLGTELQNKAESVIEVQKDKKLGKSISWVIPRDFRGIGFQEFSFVIEDGLPIIKDQEEIAVVMEEEEPF